MSTAETGSSETAVSPVESQTFSCAEVWGGNRPIDRAIALPGVRGRVYSSPCSGGRGGDIHYVSLCGSGLISRACVADVAGHGEAVGSVSSAIHQLLRSYMNNSDQRRVLSALNERLAKSNHAVLTTAAAITYVSPMRSLSVSYAGHPPAWIFRAQSAEWERVELDSRSLDSDPFVDLPLAVADETKFTRATLRVRPGDRLLVVTDGVLEAPDPAGTLFGQERLEGVLRDCVDLDVGTQVKRIVAAVSGHTGTAALAHDDLTVLLLEFDGGPRWMGIPLAFKNRAMRLWNAITGRGNSRSPRESPALGG